jgi:predicted permease
MRNCCDPAPARRRAVGNDEWRIGDGRLNPQLAGARFPPLVQPHDDFAICMIQVVIIKIAAMSLVILAGWAARRRGFLAADVTATLSRFVVDAAFPALVFTQMLRTIDVASLREGWMGPVFCGMLLPFSYLVALPLAPLFGAKQKTARATFHFLVAVPNWVFLPLPIAEALYGADGVRAVLLCNAGAQLVLWSFGVWILHGNLRQAAGNLLANTGLWATALGIGVALAVPAARDLETASAPGAGPGWVAGSAVVQGLSMVGSLTIPMSLLAIGAQLGGLMVPVHRFPRALWGVLAGRLVIAPLATLALAWLAIHAGAPAIPDVMRHTLYLIAMMPVAISCSVMAERFGGDVELSAQGTFYSTLFSLGTVPLLFWVVEWWGL